MLDSAISKHFKFHEHKYDSNKNTMYVTKRRNSHNNTFDLQPSRDQTFGYFNQQSNYCAVDYYDIGKPKQSKRGISTPVKNLKQSPKNHNLQHFYSEQKQNCSILKFEGYLSRESPFRNWIGSAKKPTISRVSQIQKINNYVRNIEKNQKCESQQLQEYLNAITNRIELNSLPKVFDYQRCETPDILKEARVKVRKF